MKTQKERMAELLKGRNEDGERYLTDSEKHINESRFKSEISKIQNNLSGKNNEWMKEGYYANYAQPGKTVNSIVQDQGFEPKTSRSQELQEMEALEISIKRTLKSGSPINNLGFYEEVNWNMQNLGFQSKLPVDIKTVLIDIMNGTEF